MDFVIKDDALFLGKKKIRVTSDTPKLISVIDTIAGVSGQSVDASGHIWRRLNEQYNEVCFFVLVVRTSVRNNFVLFIKHSTPQVKCKVKSHKFEGRGQRDTPVATIENLVYIISRVPGSAARKLAEASAETLTRYLGGDITLADEVHAIAAVQNELATTNPSHPARLFGEAVEESVARAAEWRTQRTLQKQAGAECTGEITATGLKNPRSYAYVNNRKNQSVIGFDQTTAQFKIDNNIKQANALTEFMTAEQLSAHGFMSLVLKRKLSESAPTTAVALETCADRESARLKAIFGEIGVHTKTLVHHEKRILALEKTVTMQNKAIEAAAAAGPSTKKTKTTNIYSFFSRVAITDSPAD